MARLAPLPKAGLLKNSPTNLEEVMVIGIFGAFDGSVRVHTIPA
jgi:hypothetical protein